MNYLGMDSSKVKGTVKELNILLSNYHLYYQNLRNFHWNIQGENFLDLHEQFEQLYDDARMKIDEIAERILTLRMRPVSQFSEYLDLSEVKEAGQVREDIQMINIILENHRIIIENMRRVIEAADEVSDEGTIDMIGGFLSNLEKVSWMLDAWRSSQKVMA